MTPTDEAEKYKAMVAAMTAEVHEKMKEQEIKLKQQAQKEVEQLKKQIQEQKQEAQGTTMMDMMKEILKSNNEAIERMYKENVRPDKSHEEKHENTHVVDKQQKWFFDKSLEPNV